MTLPIYVAPPQYIYAGYAQGSVTNPKIRVLYDNLQALAGDDGGGYGTSGLNIGGGFPLGNALSVYENQIIWKHHQHNIGWWGPVVTLRHTFEYLLYRTIGALLYFLDENGRETGYALEDCVDTIDDTHPTLYPFRVLHLTEIKNLAIGIYYDIRVEPGTKESPKGTLIDYVKEVPLNAI